MAGVDFLINIKEKGSEIIDKNKKSIENLAKAEKTLESQLKATDKATDKLVDSTEDLSKEQEGTVKSTNKVSTAFKKMRDNVESNIKSNDKLVSTSKNIGIALGAAIATASAALIAYSKIIIDVTDQQSKMAQKAGVDFDVFFALGEASSFFGVEAENLSEKLIDMSIAIQEASNGGGELLSFLNELNIDATELAKLSPEKQFFALSKAIKDLPDGERLLFLDKAKIKDVKILADNYEALNKSVNGLLATGLIPKSGKEFEDFNDNISTSQINVKNFSASVLNDLLPAVNQLYTRFNEDVLANVLDEKGAENTVKVIKSVINVLAILSNVVSVTKNSIELAFEVLVGFGNMIADIFTTPVRVAYEAIQSFGEYLINNFSAGITKMKNGIFGAASSFKGLEASARTAYAVILENLGMEEKAREQFSKAIKSQLESEELDKKSKIEVEIVPLNTTNIEQEIARLNANKFEVFKNRIKNQTDDLSEDIADIFKNTQDLVNLNDVDVYGKAEKNTKQLEEQSVKTKEIVDNTLNEINKMATESQKKVLDSFIPTYQDYIDKINLLKTKMSLGEENGGINESTFKSESLKVYEDLLDLVKDTNKEFEVRLMIKDFLAKKEEKSNEKEKEKLDIFKDVNLLKDKYNAGMIKEEVLLINSIVEYNKIIELSKDQNEIMQARIGLFETETKLKDIEIKKQEEYKKQEMSFLDLKVEVLKAQGKELEALELKEQSRLDAVKEQFEGFAMQAEAVELEKSLINTEKTQIQLDTVKQQIDDLNSELNSNNFFTDSERNAQIQNDMIRLKKEQIALEGKHADAIDKTSSLSLFTYEQAVKITQSGFDILASSFSNIIAQTDKTEVIVRKMVADILTEINKVLLRQIALNVATSIGGNFGGGFGQAFSGLIGSAFRNHSGLDVVTPDHTSGKYGLQTNEVLRVLTTDEMVLNRVDAKNALNKTSAPSTVNANVNINAGRVAPAIIREGYSSLDEWAQSRGLF